MKTTTKKVTTVAACVFAAAGVWMLHSEFSPIKAAEPLPASPSAVAAPSGLVDLSTAAEKTVNAVVYIKVTQNGKTQTVEGFDPFSEFFGDFFGRGNGGTQRRQVQTPKQVFTGSGVIVDSEGYIVTNNHVVEGADVIQVTLNDNREFKARIIGTDPATDLALIKIEQKNLPSVSYGNSDDLKIGEWVLAVGNPFNLTSTVTAGIVSAKARNLGASTGIESFIQTDAAINKGNSGGALVNSRGELVGINTMIYSQTGSYAGYGFAVPSAIVKKVVADIRQYGTVQRALLGITGGNVADYIDAEREKNGSAPDLGTVDGIYVNEVTPGSAAAEAGLRKGDVVTNVDGKKVGKMAELQERIVVHQPGDKVSITYMRDKKSHTATATLKNSQGTTKVVKEVDMDELGVGVRALNDDELRQYNLSFGLIVSGIKAGKMQEAGVKKGVIILQVNDQPMRTKDDFDAAVQKAQKTADRTLWIRAITQSGVKTSYVVDLDNQKSKK